MKDIGEKKKFNQWMKTFKVDQVDKETMDEFFQLFEGSKDQFRFALLELLRIFLSYND